MTAINVFQVYAYVFKTAPSSGQYVLRKSMKRVNRLFSKSFEILVPLLNKHLESRTLILVPYFRNFAKRMTITKSRQKCLGCTPARFAKTAILLLLLQEFVEL